jgi:hypothetical protein
LNILAGRIRFFSMGKPWDSFIEDATQQNGGSAVNSGGAIINPEPPVVPKKTKIPTGFTTFEEGPYTRGTPVTSTGLRG